jgi:integrase
MGGHRGNGPAPAQEVQAPTQVSCTAPPARRTRAERGIYYRQTPTGRRYEITFTDPTTGKQRWRNVEGGIREARALRGDVVAKAARGERVLTPSSATLLDVANAWLLEQTHLRPATVRWYRHALDAYIIPRLGRRAVGTIREDEVAALMTAMQANGYAAWTIKGTLTVLGRVLGYAARRGMIPDNPVRRLERSERPNGPARSIRTLDATEIRALIDTARRRYALAITLAILTGLRQGEQLGLRWRDMDFSAKVVRVRHQLDRSGNLVPPNRQRSPRGSATGLFGRRASKGEARERVLRRRRLHLRKRNRRAASLSEHRPQRTGQGC